MLPRLLDRRGITAPSLGRNDVRARREFRAEAPSIAELAAGAVVLHSEPPEALLLHHRGEDRWCLPKGHVEAGESLRATAQREVTEETGLRTFELGEELHTVSYRYFDPERGVNVFKTSVYFLAWTREKTVDPEPLFDAHRWTRFPDALGLVPYASDRETLAAAEPAWRARRDREEGKGSERPRL